LYLIDIYCFVLIFRLLNHHANIVIYFKLTNFVQKNCAFVSFMQRGNGSENV